MTEIVQLFLALGIIITVAKAFGYLTSRFGQPAVLGELIAGVLIGPSILNLLRTPGLFPDGASVEHTVIEIAELGVLLLMFSAGLEVDLQSMLKVGRTAFAAGVLGVIVPILFITPLEMLNGYHLEGAIFIGLILAATSVSISAQVMRELGVLRTREGLALLGAAVIDDILVILGISLFLALNPGGVVTASESRSFIEVTIRLVGFLILSVGLGWVLLPRIVRQINRLNISEGVLVVALVAALLYGFAAEYFGGVAAITGAFIAGICLGQADRRIVHDIESGLQRLNYGFLVPVFFVSIGLQADLRLIDASALPYALVLTLFAVLSKVIGAGAGGLLTRFPRIGALRLGIGMISRGEVGLIVAALGVRSGIISAEVFAEVVLVVLVTTILTPVLVRLSFRQPKVPPPAVEPNTDAIVTQGAESS